MKDIQLSKYKIKKVTTCIFMDPKWAKFIKYYWTLGSNKVQLFKMKGLPYGDLDIISQI